MARKVTTRWKITGTLIADTPLHIGGVGGDADTDLALAVNGRGKYYVPGTSLAGALRGWMTQIFVDLNQPLDPKNIVNQYWGFQSNDSGHASFVIVDDTEIRLQNGTIEIREGVGINRHSGTAAERCKYSRAIIPKGATFPLNITFDSQDGKLPESLIQLLQALEKGDIRIGAAKTRGLGRIKLTDLNIKAQDLDSSVGIFDALLKGGKQKDWKILSQGVTYQSPANLTVDISWEPRDPVMVKAEGDGIAIDILPLVSQVGNDVTFVIPGSSIKGVLRTQAERIIRTVRKPTTLDEDKFLEQVRLDLVNELFGSAARGKTDQGRIGALSVDDCFSEIFMKIPHWAGVENAKEMTDDLKTALQRALGQEPYKKLQPAMHVAVDRWTGGAADGMLYSVLEPIGVIWQPIGLHLDIARLTIYNPVLVKPAIALLLLVLRDLANRKIPIGYGTNRGMGTITVSKIQLEAHELDPELQPLTTTLTQPDLRELDQTLREDLTKAWQNWINLNALKEVA